MYMCFKMTVIYSHMWMLSMPFRYMGPSNPELSQTHLGLLHVHNIMLNVVNKK